MKNCNDLEIAVTEVVDYLRITGDFGDALADVVKRNLAVDAARTLGLSVTDEELQKAADIFRVGNGLFSAEDTLAWLKSNGIAEEAFESYLETSLLVGKFKDYLEKNMDSIQFLSDESITERLRELKFNRWFKEAAEDT